MQARLCSAYGWVWDYPDGTRGPFILYKATRYAGMISGYTMDGRKCCRPQTEFDALSHDGEAWHSLSDMLSQVPQEAYNNVRIQDVSLPPTCD